MPDRRKQCVTGHADHAGMVRKNPQNPPVSALIGDSAVTAGGHLTAFLRAEHAGGMMVADVGETDFAVIVYREEDQWEADVLPTAVTADLGGLVQALRRQPSIGGTIGFAGVGDDFFVAILGFGEDVSLFLSYLTAAVDYPLARQVLDALEIPVPSVDELDQVLPAGDLSIFADLVLDEAGAVITRARNRREADRDPTAHAEIVAIRQAAQSLASWRLTGLTLVVTLEPCTMCAGAVTAARLGRLVYGAEDPKAGAVGSLWDVLRDTRLNHRPEVIGGVLAEDCAAVLRDFFAVRRGQRQGG